MRATPGNVDVRYYLLKLLECKTRTDLPLRMRLLQCSRNKDNQQCVRTDKNNTDNITETGSTHLDC